MRFSELSKAWQVRLQPLSDEAAKADSEVMKWKTLLSQRQGQYEKAKSDWSAMKATDIPSADLVVAGTSTSSLEEAITAVRSELGEAERRAQLVRYALNAKLSILDRQHQRLIELDGEIAKLQAERDSIEAFIAAPPPQAASSPDTKWVVNSSGVMNEVPAGFNLASVNGLRWASESEVAEYRRVGVLLS